MGSPLTRLRGSWLTAAVFILLMVGLLGGQVIASWESPDDGYTAGFWDDDDEDTLLALVWDHSPGTVSDVSLFVTLWVTLPTATPGGDSADSVLLSSFDSRAPPLA